MMGASKLTLSSVQTLSPGMLLWDGQVKGFGAQSNRNGTVTLFVKSRINGRQRWFTIGKLGSPWTVETARKEALRVLAEGAAGNDLAAAKQARRSRGARFREVAAQFLELHGPKLKPRSYRGYADFIRLHFNPAFGDEPIGDISRNHVARLHARMSHTPTNANHALTVLTTLMNWAEGQGFRAGANPCLKIARYRENKRERYLSHQEFGRLGEALAKADNQESLFIVAALRLLLFSGARLSEVLTLQWAHVDFDRRVLALPDSKTGAKLVPLGQPALSLLAGLPRLENNPYVFPGNVAGKHLVNLQKPWRRIREDAGLQDVRLHDLRHSFASMGVTVGGSLPVIGRILGHSQPRTTARYAHVADAAAITLAEATAAQIADAIQLYRPEPLCS